jgi:hypothetical protein
MFGFRIILALHLTEGKRASYAMAPAKAAARA